MKKFLLKIIQYFSWIGIDIFKFVNTTIKDKVYTRDIFGSDK